MSRTENVPTFYLYGEPHRLVGDDFVHAESLDDRSRPSEWTIRPHFHAELCHILLISTGGGRMRADDHDIGFTAPCFLIVPSKTVHGFVWLEESSGTVITAAVSYIGGLARHDGALSKVFANARTLALSRTEHISIERCVADLMRELAWSAPGHRAAVDSTILALLVFILRNAEVDDRPAAKPGHHAASVARLRERIEQRYRLRESISSHAAALGISETALRTACSRVAGMSPAEMLDQRSLLEAKRSLLYSNLSVAEIGYSLGFADPAYFSRFFSRHAGMSPKNYRNSRSQQPR